MFRRARTVGVILVSILLSCRIPEIRESDGKPSEFSQLAAQNASTIDDYPQGIDAQEVRTKLLNAVLKEGITSDYDPRITVMNRLPNSGLALTLAKEVSAELETDDAEKCASFYETLLYEHSNDAIGALACDRLLSLKRRSSDDAFLSSCKAMIDSAKNTKAKSIALLKRSEYFDVSGDVKSAAIDSLSYWSLFPERAKAAGLELVFLGRLERAGFVLEAGMLETARKPGEIAEVILADLQSLLSSMGSADSEGEHNPNVIYAEDTPDIARIVSLVNLDKVSDEFVKITYLARVARLQIDRLDEKGTEKFLAAYLPELDNLINSKILSHGQLAMVRLMNLSLYHATEKLLGESGFARDREGSSFSHRSLSISCGQVLSKLSELQAIILRNYMDATAVNGPGAVQEVLDERIDFARHVGNQKDIVDAYEFISSRFPNSPEACQALLCLGKYYEKEMKVPALAAATYQRIMRSFPQSKEASEAGLRNMLSLYESGKYSEAYMAAQTFLSDHPKDDLVTAKMLSALSEAGLGLADDATTHMRQIIEEYPQSDLAPRCLFWLGSEALARQDYNEAEKTFRDLSERYPESSYANQAKEYIERLAKVSSQK